MFNAIPFKLKHLHTCISERCHVKRLKMHLWKQLSREKKKKKEEKKKYDGFNFNLTNAT